METLVQNIILLCILVFTAAFVVLGLLKFIKVLKGENTPGEAFLVVVLALLGAGFVIWAATDFNGDRVTISTVGRWIMQILTEPLG